MLTIEASYKLTTPMFMGGADPKGDPEIRPPAIKGLLRFWWRAAALPQLGSWKKVWEAERDLFGSTEYQAAFLLSTEIKGNLNKGSAGEEWKNRHGLAYLGYGAIDRNFTARPYIKPGIDIVLKLLLKKNEKDHLQKNAQTLAQGLKALGLFGGAGARTRKGFGSLTLTSLSVNGEEKWVPPASATELVQTMKRFLADIGLGHYRETMPPYTAFSAGSAVRILKCGRDALSLLDEIGRELLAYRSYGRSGHGGRHVLPWGAPAEQNFAGDHDLIQGYLQGNRINRHPKRIIFGLPHNYYFMSTKKGASVEAAAADGGRRASPLFIHIHSLKEGEYAAVAALLPAEFLPPGARIKISSSRGDRQEPVLLNCSPDYGVIGSFFDRPAFNSGMVVWP